MREASDMEEQLIIIMLDAKSAFDVVVHNNMMRRLYHLGIQDKHWSLIQNLHSNATTSVKLNGHISDRFNIQQGVRQRGILRADLYKIYVDPLLHRLQDSGKGLKIGYINCCATACADDISINCVKSDEVQILRNMAYEYSLNEHYKLQPQNSVVIQMENKRKKVNNPV